jgi:hypothetical protein
MEARYNLAINTPNRATVSPSQYVTSGGQQVSPMVLQMYQDDNTRAIVGAIEKKY